MMPPSSFLVLCISVWSVGGQDIPRIALREQPGNHGPVQMPVLAAGTGGWVYSTKAFYFLWQLKPAVGNDAALSLFPSLTPSPDTHTLSLSLPLFLSLSPRPLSRYDNATAKDAVEKAIQAGIDHVCVNIYQ